MRAKGVAPSPRSILAFTYVGGNKSRLSVCNIHATLSRRRRDETEVSKLESVGARVHELQLGGR